MASTPVSNIRDCSSNPPRLACYLNLGTLRGLMVPGGVSLRRLLALLCSVVAIAAPGCETGHCAFPVTVEERPELARAFADRGVAGTFVLYDVAAQRDIVTNRARAEQAFPPASTFKIVNSLIALETGAVRDVEEVIPYGGKPQPMPQWERDMSLRGAIAVSNVPVYQEVARRVGLERMRAWVRKLYYGNGEIGDVVDRFWLDGPLEISAMQQAAFVARMAKGELPVSEQNASLVREIIKLEERGGAVLYGKTGWATSEDPDVGWLVGWVEREGKVYAFALNMDMATQDEAPKRLQIGKALLTELGVWPAD